MFVQLCIFILLSFSGCGKYTQAYESKTDFMYKNHSSTNAALSNELTRDIELVFETNQGLDFKNVSEVKYFIDDKVIMTQEISPTHKWRQYPRKDLATLKKELDKEKELNPNSHLKIDLTTLGLIVTREIWGSAIIFYHEKMSYNPYGFLLQEKKWQTGEHTAGTESLKTNTYDHNNRVTQIQKMLKKDKKETEQYETI